MILPENVRFIIGKLNEHGHRADIVGGSVRDYYMGKCPSDYDITTDATPSEMKDIFSSLHTIETGLKHGTLTVLLSGEPYEVTTYRVDGEYLDNRRPESVTFTRKLTEDLSRRDFTVNAMCYNERDGLTDVFGGISDIENKIIRAVGEAEKRFCEDALRILRALRFSSVLDFEIEEKTALAIHKCRDLLKNVSRERIFTEWKKLVGGVGAYRVITEFSDVIAVFIPELKDIILPKKESFLLAEESIRELALFALGCENPINSFSISMTDLRSDNKRKTDGERILAHLTCDTSTRPKIKRVLTEIGEELFSSMLSLRKALGADTKYESEELSSIISLGECYTLSALKINGKDIASLGYKGERIGEILKTLLYMVEDGEVNNDKDALVAVAKSL